MQRNKFLFLPFNYRITMQFLDNLLITQSITDTENGFTAVLRCNPEHLIYQAHFPGNPITPGACLLQTAGEVLQASISPS